MKKLTILVIILFYGLKSSAYTLYTDSAGRQQQPITNPTALDSLKELLPLIALNDTLKSALYTQIATQYLNYDDISDKKTNQLYQNQALNYTYLALHLYSRLGDTSGLRTCFNSLAKVYRSQRKYPQAKWFILQSNTLSRAKNDIPNIMASLMVLANIKMEIKDYSLAKRDLDEVLKLAVANHYHKAESRVQESYVLLYTHLKNYTRADIAAKRHEFIEDSLLKNDERMIAKTQASLQAKKKIYPISRKIYKLNYTRRIASL